MTGSKQRAALVYGTLIFLAFVLIVLVLLTLLTYLFYDLNPLSVNIFERYQPLFTGIGIVFLPAGFLFALAIGWIIAQETYPQTQSEFRLDDEDGQEYAFPAGGDDDPHFDEKLHHVRDTIDSMQTAYEQIQVFSANASHELRTPLTIMRGEIELALRSSKNPEEYQRLLSSMLEEILRLSRILDDLLLIAKTEVGEKPLELKPVDLGELVREIADEAELFAEQAGIGFQLERCDEATVLGDSLQLRRVLLNLIDNAVKYNSKNGRVIMSLLVEGDHATLRIADTGIGIPEDALPKLFDRFYRVSTGEHASRKGTGLGLYFVKWIVRNHGGTISVDSTLGEGSTFTMQFPLQSSAS